MIPEVRDFGKMSSPVKSRDEDDDHQSVAGSLFDSEVYDDLNTPEEVIEEVNNLNRRAKELTELMVVLAQKEKTSKTPSSRLQLRSLNEEYRTILKLRIAMNEHIMGERIYCMAVPAKY